MAVAKKSTKKQPGAITISTDELVREFPAAKKVSFKAGASIFKEGSKAESCYVIIHGKVQILKKTSKGERIPLAVVKAGEFLGEMAMLSGEKRSASAVAVTKVEGHCHRARGIRRVAQGQESFRQPPLSSTFHAPRHPLSSPAAPHRPSAGRHSFGRE